MGRKLVFVRLFRPLFGDETQHLRNDIAGALNDHHVAHADVEALDLVGIVQGGARHHDAADIDRLEIGEEAGRELKHAAGPRFFD